MVEGLGENCAVAGVYLKNEFAEENTNFLPEALYKMLIDMQHRGQQSCGIAVYNPYDKKNFRVHKGLGFVKEVFRDSHIDERDKIMRLHGGKSGIGHVRYVTSSNIVDSEQALEEAQPLYRRHFRQNKRFAIAYNGNIANFMSLETKLKEEAGYDFETNVDTELLMSLFALNLMSINGDNRNKPDLVQVVNKISKEIDGAYSVVVLNGYGDLLAFKDPFGIRPLVYGENDKLIAIASESSALNMMGIKDFSDLGPGELLVVSDNSIMIRPYTKERSLYICCFEYVYFSSVVSKIHGRDVVAVRERLGEELAKIEPLRDKLNKDYVVVAVPNTSRPAASSLAKCLGIELVDGLIKNESMGRAFIEKKEDRERVLENKFRAVIYKVRGKNLIVVDDSIVRGDTSKKIVEMLRGAEAKEVHMRSTFPPVRSPCFYGIDFPSFDELITIKVRNRNLEEGVAKEIGATSVKYQTIEGMIRAIGMGDLCMACLTKKYPTDYGQIRSQSLNIIV